MMNCYTVSDQRLHAGDTGGKKCIRDSLGICWILWTTTKASDRPTLTG